MKKKLFSLMCMICLFTCTAAWGQVRCLEDERAVLADHHA